MEVAVRLNGVASAYSAHYAGSVSYITIIHERVGVHKARLRKPQSEMDLDDNGELTDEFPRHWVLIADKFYQGASSFLRAVTPFKRPARGVLSAQQETYNIRLPRDSI